MHIPITYLITSINIMVGFTLFSNNIKALAVAVLAVLLGMTLPTFLYARELRAVGGRAAHFILRENEDDRILKSKSEDDHDCTGYEPEPAVAPSVDDGLHPTIRCDMWKVFNHLGRNENNEDTSTPIMWGDLCDDV